MTKDIAVDQADTAVSTPVDLFAEFAVDEKSAKEGKWIPFKGDVEFLIARDGTDMHRRKLMEYWRNNPTTVEEEGDSEEAQAKQAAAIRKAAIYGAARGILLGWKGNVVYNGKPLPFSVENAEKLLNMSDFMDWVSRQANLRANFAAKAEEADAKN